MNLKTKEPLKRIVLVASSKRKQDLTSFSSCFKKLSSIIECEIFVKSKSNKKSIISILKSPHVNKIAQEQFQKKKNSCVLVLDPNPQTATLLLFFIKILLSSKFSGINLRLMLVTLHESEINYKKPTIIKKFDYKKISNNFCYLSLLDAEGEVKNSAKFVK